MNHVTQTSSRFRVGVSGGSGGGSHDFVALLDEKLRRRNRQMMGKLLAWGELLDAAGWSVVLGREDGGIWLSGLAERDLRRLGDVPATWGELIAALAGISAGSIHAKVGSVMIWSGNSTDTETSVLRAGLTKREAEVMFWLRQGKTGPEIAIIFGCATRTVEKHLANLYRKLGVSNRASVILKPSNTES